MNMIKKTDGFTLVELIVVIAILAILAAIAVPAYSGYIAKANEAADQTQLDGIKTAAAFAYVDDVITADPTADTDVTDVYVVVDATAALGIKVYVNVAPTDTGATATDISTYYTTFPGFKSDKFATGAQWHNGGEWDTYPTPVAGS